MKVKNNHLKILLAAPRGFCAGVDRAIEIVKKSIEKYGAPVYVRHEIVHNKHVVDGLKKIGAIFVEEIDEIEDKTRPVIFSAHGVPKSVPQEAESLNMIFVDATCPLVSKVHREAENLNKKDVQVLLIGHKNHPEVIGTMGQVANGKIDLIETIDDAKNYQRGKNDNLAYITQTTLSVDDTKDIINVLKERFPDIHEPKKDDICYATQNRQDAVKQLALESDYIIVVGSKNSSNSNRLKELAEKCGCKSILIDEFSDLDLEDLQKFENIAITAGASAPESRVMEIAKSLENYFDARLTEDGEDTENVYFKMPPGLR